MFQRKRHERGIATIEFAVGITLAVVATVWLVALSLLGVAQAACAESSAQLARQAARGDQALLAEAKARAPEGASITVQRGPDGVTARVSMNIRALSVGAVEVSAETWAAYEPGVGP